MLRTNVRPAIHAKTARRLAITTQTLPHRSVRLFPVTHTPRLHTELDQHKPTVRTKTPPSVAAPAAREPLRFFATDSQILRQFKKSEIKRVSIQEPRADEMIVAIRKGDYALAQALKKQGVNVDGHNRGENTPLADAAKRGDTKAVLFLLEVLKANPNASCDCPFHRTALIYAAMNGDIETVKALLKNGASIEARDSSGKTAIDVTPCPKVKTLLIAHQASEDRKSLEAGMPVRKSLPKC